MLLLLAICMFESRLAPADKEKSEGREKKKKMLNRKRNNNTLYYAKITRLDRVEIFNNKK